MEENRLLPLLILNGEGACCCQRRGTVTIKIVTVLRYFLKLLLAFSYIARVTPGVEGGEDEGREEEKREWKDERRGKGGQGK